MTQIVFENECSIMNFDYADAVFCLSDHIDKYKVKQDILLLEWLQNQSKQGTYSITLNIM